MTEKTVSATIEILGKLYPIRCAESELKSLQQAAEFLNKKMSEVQQSGKAINLERIAIITALNITHQFLQMDQQKSSFLDKVHQHIASLQDKLDVSLNRATASRENSTSTQAELIYTAE